jgi:hypothetical protein
MTQNAFSNSFLKALSARFLKWFAKSADSGSDMSIFLAISEEGGKHSGKYWMDNKIQPPPEKSNQDENTARRLWDETVKILERVQFPVAELLEKRFPDGTGKAEKD